MRFRSLRPLLGLVAAAALSGGVRAAEPAPLHVAGTSICDASGATVVLRGVDICSLEWLNGGDHLLASVRQAIGPWHANLIRLPIAQDRWMGRMPDDASGPDRSDGGAAYRALVDRVVATAAAAGVYVLVDLHWSDMGRWGQDVTQHCMPDDNTLVAWRDIARRYANRPSVLFDAYNEPFGVAWDVWRNGGQVTEKGSTYHSPGMQGLLEAIRAAGADNIVAIGGLDYAFDLRGIGQGFALTGSNLIYSCHVYPSKSSDWDGAVAPAAKIAPLLIGEFGTDPVPGYARFMTRVIAWIGRHHYSGCAWCMHVAASPCLIADWRYDRTYWDGTYVWNWLRGGPSAPMRLSADGAASAGIALSWSAVPGAASYTVYRSSTGAEAQQTAIADHLTQARYVDVTADPQSTYYYRVTALAAGGESGLSPASGARLGSAGSIALPEPVFRLSTTVSSAAVNPHEPVTVTVRATDAGAPAGSIMIIGGVTDAAGNRLATKEFSHLAFAHGQTRTFTFSFSPAQPGAYATGAAAFGDGYSPRYAFAIGSPFVVK